MSDWKKFETTPTEVLIECFQGCGYEQSVRNDAFLALMFRFRQDILVKCEKICASRGYNLEVAQLIAERSFGKYGKTKKFKIPEKNEFSVDTYFKLYLYKIAKNELNSYYREEEKRKKGLLYDGTENIITSLPKINLEKLDEKSRILHETLLRLPYSHQVIYLTYTAHEKDGVNLPRILQAKLRAHLGGIDQSTIRCYKKEAIDKMETAKRIIDRLI